MPVETPFSSASCFLLGSPSTEELLARVRAWIGQVTGSLSDQGVSVETFGSFDGVRLRLGDIRRAAPPDLVPRSLAIVTRGLPPQPADMLSNQAILLHGVTGEALDDVVLSEEHLDYIGRPALHVEPRPSAAGRPDAFRERVEEIARFLEFLRGSSYRSVYLCACGGGRPLDRLATALHDLLGLTVYYNQSPVVIEATGGGPLRARVSSPTGTARGTSYAGDRTVDLVSSGDGFLPGSEASVA